MRKIINVVVLVLAGVIALAGCGATVDTQPDEVAIRYSGTGFNWEAQEFQECFLDPFAGRSGGDGDKVYTYPAGERTFKFSADPGSDAPPLAVTVQGGIELTVSGTVRFQPKFTDDCEALQQFHERIGLKFQAFELGVDDTSTAVVEGLDGWRNMLGIYIKDPVDRAVDDASLGYTWQQLSSDTAAKAQWEQSALTKIKEFIESSDSATYFDILGVVLQKPALPAGIVEGLNNQQRAQLEAEAAAAAAESARLCDLACQQYQETQARINLMNRSGGVPSLLVPYGSPVQVPTP